jgi:hypothetical protein
VQASGTAMEVEIEAARDELGDLESEALDLASAEAAAKGGAPPTEEELAEIQSKLAASEAAAAEIEGLAKAKAAEAATVQAEVTEAAGRRAALIAERNAIADGPGPPLTGAVKCPWDFHSESVLCGAFV